MFPQFDEFSQITNPYHCPPVGIGGEETYPDCDPSKDPSKGSNEGDGLVASAEVADEGADGATGGRVALGLGVACSVLGLLAVVGVAFVVVRRQRAAAGSKAARMLGLHEMPNMTKEPVDPTAPYGIFLPL